LRNLGAARDNGWSVAGRCRGTPSTLGIGPARSALHIVPDRRLERLHESLRELGTWTLDESHVDHLHGCARGRCPDGSNELAISRKTDLLAHRDVAVEAAIVEPPQPQGRDGVDVLAATKQLATHGLRHVLIEEDLQGAPATRSARASSSKDPRTASSLSVGYSETISAIVMPRLPAQMLRVGGDPGHGSEGTTA